MTAPNTAAAGQPAHRLDRGICLPRIPHDYPEQRYFSGKSAKFHHRVDSETNGSPLTRVGVYRCANTDEARLTIEVPGAAEAHSYLSADALREVAARLLDAAHDIGANPASALMASSTVEAD